MVSDRRIRQIIQEELTKSDEKKIREIIADSVSELFKNLWQKKGFWQTDMKK